VKEVRERYEPELHVQFTSPPLPSSETVFAGQLPHVVSAVAATAVEYVYEVAVKNKPTDPSRLTKESVPRKRIWSDSSDKSPVKTKTLDSR
jgi:hypothetical protein